jgi:hypothetical protein
MQVAIVTICLVMMRICCRAPAYNNRARIYQNNLHLITQQ